MLPNIAVSDSFLHHPLEGGAPDSAPDHDASHSELEDTTRVPPVPLLIRFGAALVDVLVIGLAVALAAVAGAFAFGVEEFARHFTRGFDYVLDGLLLRRHVGSLLLAFGALVFIAYGTLCHTLFGTTLGKSIFGLRVLTRDDTHPSFGESLGRTIASGVFLLLGGFGLAWLLVDPARHSLHDRLVSTRVERIVEEGEDEGEDEEEGETELLDDEETAL